MLLAPDVGEWRLLDEVLKDGLVVPEFGPDSLDRLDPRLEDVSRAPEDIVRRDWPVMAEAEHVWIQLPKPIDVGQGLLWVEIRWRGRGPDDVAGGDVDACRIAGEDHPGRGVVKDDLMRGVAGRVMDGQVPVAEVDPVAIDQRAGSLLGDGDWVGIVTPLIADGALRPRDQSLRVDEVGLADLVDDDFGVGTVPSQPSGATRVVEVDVSRGDDHEVRGVDPDRVEGRPNVLVVGTDPGVDNGGTGRVDQVDRPVLGDPIHAGVHDVNVGSAGDGSDVADGHTPMTAVGRQNRTAVRMMVRGREIVGD